jgi:hypothetical protein
MKAQFVVYVRRQKREKNKTFAIFFSSLKAPLLLNHISLNHNDEIKIKN